MCCPPKLPFFIKNVPLNFTICYMYLYGIVPLNYHFPKKKNVLLNFTICYMYLYGIVPLNYHFSKEKCPLKLQNLLYISICIVPLNYHFS